MNKTRALLILIGLALLGFFAYGYSFFTRIQTIPTPQNVVKTSSHRTLKSVNASYLEADTLFLNRDYSEAIKKYNKALDDVTSLNAEIFIKYQIAGATLNLGDRVKAAQLFKDIVDNPKYTDDDPTVKKAKAAAIGMMIRVFYQTSEKAVSDIIFSGKPFEDFAKEAGGNIDDTILHLAEYASSLSSPPEVIIEARIADLYAIKVYNLKKKGNLSEDEKKKVEQYENMVKEKIAFINTLYDNAQNYYQYSKEQSLPIVLRLKGAAVGSLTAVGDGDASLGNPEEIFQQALAVAQPPWTRTMTSLDYAVFLAAAYGQERRDDIDSLLQDFYNPPTGSEYAPETLLVNERDNPTHKTSAFRIIASASPKFKALLAKFGWKF
ncbi:MAG: hypothetical protein AAB539_02270 [Patescibacteria group bacterium]